MSVDRLSKLVAVDERRPLRPQPDDHNFGSLLMLAITAGAFLLVTWVATKSSLAPPPIAFDSLKAAILS